MTEDYEMAALGSYRAYRTAGVVCRDGDELVVRATKPAGSQAWSAEDIMAAQHPTSPTPLKRRGTLLPIELDGSTVRIGGEVWDWRSDD